MWVLSSPGGISATNCKLKASIFISTLTLTLSQLRESHVDKNVDVYKSPNCDLKKVFDSRYTNLKTERSLYDGSKTRLYFSFRISGW